MVSYLLGPQSTPSGLTSSQPKRNVLSLLLFHFIDGNIEA